MIGVDTYPFERGETEFEYRFWSLGSREIRKVARFTEVQAGGLYNFGFGDWDEQTQDLIDTIVSNNGDDMKILGTLAQIIYTFFLERKDVAVFVKGVTPARTRKYQMGLNKHQKEIMKHCFVTGEHEGSWRPFVPGVNFNAFIIQSLNKTQL